MPSIFRKARDPISSYTHILGALLSAFGLLLMIFRLVTMSSTVVTAVSCILFCLSLIALYSASGFYHFSTSSEKVIKVLRKLDHAMIYVLIAGSYTPVLLKVLPPPKSYIFTIVIWAVALSGIIMKLFWINAPRWLTSSLYILMGWAIVIDFSALVQFDMGAMILLLIGGICYTVGGVIYAFKWPNFSKSFGFHEFFHIFCMLGSFFHFIMVFLYVAR